MPELGLPHGFVWPTRQLPATNAFWTFDHFLVKGVPLSPPPAAGVVRDDGGASDHRPVWIDLLPARRPSVRLSRTF